MDVKAIPHDPMLPFGKDKCRCMDCGEYFNSTYAFDKHRKGSYQPDERRCLRVLDMQSSGWTRGPKGHWLSPRRGAGARVRAQPDEPPEPDGECFRGGEAAAYEAEQQAWIQRNLK